MITKLPFCPDVSHWKEIPDFSLISPKPFLMITKATEGTTIIDTKFIRFFDGMKSIGCHRGAYHFFRKAQSAVAQAQYFCDFVRPYVTDNDILILDMEEGGEDPAAVLVWFDYVRTQFPRNRVLLYSRRNVLEALVMTTAQRERFKDIGVWVAGYPTNPDAYDAVPSWFIPDPTRFGAVVLWQYSANGLITGIEGDVDMNWISPIYQAILGEPQEETEIPMARYEAISTYGMSLRPDHSTANTPIATIPAQSKFHGDVIWEAPGEKWLQVTDINGFTRAGWVAIVHASRVWCALTDSNPVVTDEIFVDVNVDLTATLNGKEYHGAVIMNGIQLKPV